MQNPILRSIELGRATPEEIEEALEALHNISIEQATYRVLGYKPVELLSMAETLEEAKANIVEGDKINGLSTGYDSLDGMTRGLAKGEIIVLFGDTSHGKSQLAQNITLNLALKEIPVCVIGLEMTNTENTVRFLQMLGPKEDQFYYKLPIFYPKSSDIGYKDIDSIVKAATSAGTQLIVLDHLHMLTRNVDNLANEISLITHELKRVARKYEIPIIVISHINRAGTKKGVPELSDLKGSGSIEQDADVAIAVWRDMNLDDDKQVLKVVLRKNRNRGRKHWVTELAILPNARLAEIVSVF